jgi:Cu-processing system permease protein
VSDVMIIARHTVREALRRRVVTVVLVLTAGFLALFGLGVYQVRDSLELARELSDIDARQLASVTLVGLAMFATLFLGGVLAVFLASGAVRGDAERGVLQPIVVRPVGRTAFLAGRWLAASAVSALYALAVYGLSVGIVGSLAGRWPDQIVAPGLWLAAAVVVIVTLALLVAVELPTMASGIAVFMAFGAGLVGGLMRSLAEGLSSQSLEDIAQLVSWAFPFEALYQAGLAALTADVEGVEGALVQLGPFGSSHRGGLGLVLFALAWVAAAALVARRRFATRDL